MFKKLKDKLAQNEQQAAATEKAKSSPKEPNASATSDSGGGPQTPKNKAKKGEETPQGKGTTDPTLSAASSTPESPKKHADEVTTEEMVRLEAAPREELIDMVVRQKKDINRRKRKLADLVQAYKTLTTSKEKVEAALEKQQDTTTRRTKELKDMHKKDTEAKDKLAEALKRKVADLERLVRDTQEEMALFKVQNKDLQATLVETDANSRRGDKNLEKLRSVLGEQEANLKAQEAMVKELQTAKKSLQQRNEELMLSLKQKDVDLGAQMEMNATLRESLQSRGAQDDNSTQVDALNNTIKEMKTSLADKESRLASFSTAEKDWNEARDRLTKDVARIADENAANLKQNEKLKKTLLKLRNEHETLQTTRGELEQAEAQRAAQQQEWEAERTRLQGELDALAKDTGSAQKESAKQLDKYKKTMQKLRNEHKAAVDKAGAELQSMEEQKRTLESSIAEMAEEHKATADSLKAKITSADDALSVKVTECEHAEKQSKAARKTLQQKTKSHATEVEQLRSEIAQLQEQHREATSLADNTTTSLQKNEGIVTDLQAKLEKAREDLQRTTAKLAEAQNEAQQCQREEQSAQADATAAREKIVALERLTKMMQQTIDDKEEQYKRLKSANHELDTKLVDKAEGVIKANAETSALRIQLESLETGHTRASAEWDTERKALRTDSDRMTKEIKKAKKIISNLKNELEAGKEALQAERKARAEADALVTSTQASLDDNNKALKDCRGQVAQLETTVQDSEAEKTALQAQIKAQQAELSTSTSASAELETRTNALEKELQQMATELKTSADKLRKEEANAASYQYTSETQAEELATLRAQVQTLQNDLALRDETHAAATQLAESVHAQLSERVEATEAQAQSLQNELAAVRTEAETREAEIATLTASLQEKTSAMDETSKQLTELTAELASAQAEMGELTANVKDIAAELASQTATLDTRTERVSALEAEVATLTEQLSASQAESADLSSQLATTVEEHQIATKLQQKHAAELKKTLQKSLKGQPTTASDLEVIGAQPSTLAGKAKGALDVTPQTPTHGASGTTTPQYLTPSQTFSPATYPTHLETNFQYLRNIILKYMTSPSAEGKQLVNVIATVLKFTKEEKERVQKHNENSGGLWSVLGLQ
eukprot:m.669308 g.669308  ORF g.669308 m.669308 type:complete len:1133 (-) comp22761_c0_seq5:717-4115(-)